MTRSDENRQLEELERARNNLAEQIERSQKTLLDLDQKIASLKEDLTKLDDESKWPVTYP